MVAWARFRHLPHVDACVENHGAPLGWPIEWSEAALGSTPNHDDAVANLRDVVEDVSLVGKAVEEPSPRLHAGVLPFDGRTR